MHYWDLVGAYPGVAASIARVYGALLNPCAIPGERNYVNSAGSRRMCWVNVRAQANGIEGLIYLDLTWTARQSFRGIDVRSLANRRLQLAVPEPKEMLSESILDFAVAESGRGD